MGLISSDDTGITRGKRLGIFFNVVLICALGTALAVGAVALVKKLSFDHDLRVDTTSDRRYELDPLASQLLRDLEAPLSIDYVWGYDQDILSRVLDMRGNPRTDLLEGYYRPLLEEVYVRLSRVLREWEHVSPNVKLRMVQAETNPRQAEQIASELAVDGGDILNRVIFRLGNRRRVVPIRRIMVDMQWGAFPANGREQVLPRPPASWRTHEELTAALRSISLGETIKVGVVKGLNGRVEMGTPHGNTLAAVLSVEGYETEPFTLSGISQVPSRFGVVILPAPKAPMDASQTRLLDSYMRSGGRVLLIADPTRPADYSKLLEPYGLKFIPGMVRDTKYSRRDRESQGLVMESTELVSEQHPITNALYGRINLFAGQTRPMTTAKDHAAGIERRMLLLSSEAAMAVPIVYSESDGRWTPRTDAPPFKIGKAALGATLERRYADGKKSRCVVLGTAELFTPDYMLAGARYGNRDFVLNTLSWLVERKSAIGLTPRPEERDRYVLVSRIQSPFTVVGVIILPLLSFMAACVIYFLRRA